MARYALTFLSSTAACCAAAVAAIYVAGNHSATGAIVLSFTLLTIFTISATLLKLSSQACLAGLLTGAVIATAVLVFFDWAIARPADETTTLEALISYARLYNNLYSLMGLLTPTAISLTAFFIGRRLAFSCAILSRRA